MFFNINRSFRSGRAKLSPWKNLYPKKNHIKTDENDNIVDIYEHVTDQNKKDYIPEQSIMLADDRETKNLAEQGINVVNVQGEKFRNDILNISIKTNQILIKFKEIQFTNKEKEESIKHMINRLLFLNKEIKIQHEEYKTLENIISQYLILYEKLITLLLELI